MSKAPYPLDYHGVDRPAPRRRWPTLPRVAAVAFAGLSLVTGLANFALWCGAYASYAGTIDALGLLGMFAVVFSSVVGFVLATVAWLFGRNIGGALLGMGLNFPSAVVAIGVAL